MKGVRGTEMRSNTRSSHNQMTHMDRTLSSCGRGLGEGATYSSRCFPFTTPDRSVGMDARLQHLTDLIQQGIEEAVKTVREQEKEENRLQECVKLIKKLRGEISSEQKDLNAERKKAAALSARSKKLDKDMQLWQQKLDHFVSQAKEMKSHYVGKMGADVMDTEVEADESLVIASLPVVDTAVNLTQLLPLNEQEHDCDMWTSDSAHKEDHRDPMMLPSTQLVKNGDGYGGSPKGKKGGRGRKRKLTASESDLDDLPKKRVVRKRIVDADGTVAKLSSGNGRLEYV